MHGGVAKDDLKTENVGAVAKGCENLTRHLENLRKFGVPPVVAINRFITDTDKEVAEIVRAAESAGAKSPPVHALGRWRQGHRGPGCARSSTSPTAASPSSSRSTPTRCRSRDKVKTIATEIYRASDIACDSAVEARFRELQAAGYGHLPVCMAKTQYSFSTDPNRKGAPTGHIVPIRGCRLSAGAEFIVAITGEIMTMPACRNALRQRHPPQRQGPDRGSVLIFCEGIAAGIRVGRAALRRALPERGAPRGSGSRLCQHVQPGRRADIVHRDDHLPTYRWSVVRECEQQRQRQATFRGIADGDVAGNAVRRRNPNLRGGHIRKVEALRGSDPRSCDLPAIAMTRFGKMLILATLKVADALTSFTLIVRIRLPAGASLARSNDRVKPPSDRSLTARLEMPAAGLKVTCSGLKFERLKPSDEVI